jgi:hypothetical protein
MSGCALESNLLLKFYTPIERASAVIARGVSPVAFSAEGTCLLVISIGVYFCERV